MSKKRNRKKLPTATGVVWRQSAEEATLASKPLYNGFACGHGAHGSKKYQRSKAEQAWKKQLRQEGAPRGSFRFLGVFWHRDASFRRLLACSFRRAALSDGVGWGHFAIMALEEKGRAL